MKPIITEKDTGRNRESSEVAIDAEDCFNSLLKVTRHSAHQLNNILTTILANAQLMFLVLKDEELKPYLRAVEDGTRDAGMVVRSLQETVQATARVHLNQKTE